MSPTEAESDDPAEQIALRRFAAGEPAAVRAIERHVRAVVYHRGFRLSAEDRDDIVQDTLAALWRQVGRSEFQLTHSLRALARTIAAARIIDLVRRRRTQVELDPGLADRAPGPLDLALAGDERARLRVMLRTLGAACLELIRWHFLEDLPYAEIARREGRNESTLRVRMFQCLQTLRRRVKPEPE